MVMHPKNRLLDPGVKYYALAAVPFVAVFFLVPFELYFNGREYWNFSLAALFQIPAFGLLACLAVLALIRLLAFFLPAAAAQLAIVLFCLGTFLLLADLYAPAQISPLDGTDLSSNEPLALTILEAAVAVALVFAFLLLRRERYLTAAYVFSLAVIVVGLAYGGLIALTARTASADHVAATPARGLQGNVYHLVLDEMQTDVALTVLEAAAYRKYFDGFTLFRNNISNYIMTEMSLPSYFTGTFYHTGEVADWQDNWKTQGLLATLAKHGYATTMYSPTNDWNGEHVQDFNLLVDVYEEELGISDSDFPEFIDLWLTRLAPNFLTTEALSLSHQIRVSLGQAQTLEGAPAPLRTETGSYQRASVSVFRQLLANEDRRAPDGEYLYAHAILPHQPYVMDADCRFSPDMEPSTQASFLLQAECAFKLVAAFLAELKRLDRYDDATIIVHADTGSWTGFLDRGGEPGPAPVSAANRQPDVVGRLGLSEAEASPWLQIQSRKVHEREIFAARTQALLMIKRPHEKGDLEVSDVPTQLVDIFPTVLEVLGLDPPESPIHGRSVYELNDKVQRSARYAYKPRYDVGSDMIEVRIENQSDLEHSALTVIGPASDPRFWREELRGG